MDSEADSIARLKAGDIAGLAVLVDKYQVQAIRTAYLIVRDRSLAEDISQAAFIRAYERIGQFHPEASFGPWFMRSVANDAIKALERGRRTSSLDDDDGSTTALLDPANDPAAAFDQAEQAAAIWSLLDGLPAKQRAVIVLRYFVGLSDREIAEYLELPAATVRWRLHAARQRMRSWLPTRAD